jgi:hypothetical protein
LLEATFVMCYKSKILARTAKDYKDGGISRD